MSSASATAEITADTRGGLGAPNPLELLGRAATISLSRTQRMRLLLLTAAALVATVLPLALDAAHALGAAAGGRGDSGRTVASILVLGLIPPLASLRLSTVRIVGIGMLVAVLLLLLGQHRVHATMMLALAYPAAALVLSVVGTLAVHHVMVEFEHEHQRLMCTRFVPEQVVEELLKPDVQIGLGGKEVAGTIVFVDLRGFTGFAETRPAGQVIRVLNHYLTEISCAIQNRGGTIISYLGDGLMAVFGAPIEQEDHADRALAAAREILELHLPHANVWMEEQGLGAGFRLGIGINSGSFIAGNVGNDRRLEYTAIGDVANTAARIQDITKAAGRMLLVDRSTCRALKEPADDLVCVGCFEVRGRHGKVELWSLDCDRSADLPQVA